MARFTGTDRNEIITPAFVSASVTVFPAGLLPSAISDQLFGFGGNDVLEGGAGNDTLDGGTGNDRMTGGAGSDTYLVDSAGDVITSEAVNGGIDTVTSSIAFTLGANLENLFLTKSALNGTGNAGSNTLAGNTASNILVGLDGDDLLSGVGGNDTLRGGNGNDKLNGGIGIDALYGGAGDDRLDGGTGADTMDGGTGNDTYYVDNIGDVVIDTAILGVDTVQSSLSFTLSAWLENLILIGSALNGIGNAANNAITGDDLANMLAGMAGDDNLKGFRGNDILNGGLGADSMAGGPGDDAYFADNVRDVIIELPSGGIDNVKASVSYALSPNVEKLTLIDAAGHINGVGNDSDNRITDNSGNNILSGLGGNDMLVGGLGHDILYGGTGNDTLSGGLGDDTLNGQDGNDALDGSYGDDVLRGVDGDDTLEDYYGNNTLDGGAGNDGLWTGSGDDVLNGGPGADAMHGGQGADNYVVDDVNDQTLEGSSGEIDTVQASVSFRLPGYVERLALAGTADLNGYGNPQGNRITGNAGNNFLSGLAGNDALYGQAGNDSLHGGPQDDYLEGGDGVDKLYGDLGVDQLTGGAGNDLLDGGEGLDGMAGGRGNDTYVVDYFKVVTRIDHGTEIIDHLEFDNVFEDALGGIDTVKSSTTFILPDNVENLILIAPLTVSDGKGVFPPAGAIGGTGNELDNVIEGDRNPLTRIEQWLNGGGGNDLISGGLAGDTLFGGNGADTLYGDLGADELYGGDIFSTDADSSPDVLHGDQGDDFLEGGRGNDLLDGGPGADTFSFLSIFDSLPGLSDEIRDFSKADHDIIDLRDVYLRTFHWIGSAPFSANATGELRYANGLLQGSVNATATQRIEISLFGAPALTAGDLRL